MPFTPPLPRCPVRNHRQCGRVGCTDDFCEREEETKAERIREMERRRMEEPPPVIDEPPALIIKKAYEPMTPFEHKILPTMNEYIRELGLPSPDNEIAAAVTHAIASEMRAAESEGKGPAEVERDATLAGVVEFAACTARKACFLSIRYSENVIKSALDDAAKAQTELIAAQAEKITALQERAQRQGEHLARLETRVQALRHE